jgi:hypothetical protein
MTGMTYFQVLADLITLDEAGLSLCQVITSEHCGERSRKGGNSGEQSATTVSSERFGDMLLCGEELPLAKQS